MKNIYRYKNIKCGRIIELIISYLRIVSPPLYERLVYWIT